ncbi:MAG: PLP-dependent aminotransferase family protein [Pseudomonadota bacterium]
MAKQARDLPLPALTLDTASPTPLHRQIYFEIRNAILDGRLRPGARLPASRALARDLSVSRNTVTTAFDQLVAEGYVEARTGAGSFVPAHLPKEQTSIDHQKIERHTDLMPFRPAPSKRAIGLMSIAGEPAARRPFSPGLPEVERFPFKEWARLLGRHWRRPTRDDLTGAAPGGDPRLCRAVAEHLAAARAVFCRPEQVIVTTGSRQALDLAARVLIDPGDPVWIEEPGYRPTAAVLGAAGAKLVPVPVDDEGLNLIDGLRMAPNPRLICISPSHQYPLGVTMSLGRRLDLLETARAAGSFLLEDDYDSEYRYAGRPLAALQGLDQGGQVIYLGTFSKVMFPGVRLGYMVVPDHLLDTFLKVRILIDAHPSSIAQAALADFIEEGHLAGHIRRMRPLYAERQAALIQTLGKLTDRLSLSPADAGMHLVAKLQNDVDDQAISKAAARAGVQAPPLSRHYHGSPRASGLVLGYAGADVATIERASAELCRVIETR